MSPVRVSYVMDYPLATYIAPLTDNIGSYLPSSLHVVSYWNPGRGTVVSKTVVCAIRASDN
jgi:hypothetical protein